MKMSKSQWMQIYEETIVCSLPKLVGRIDWQTAEYQYSSNQDARLAALSTVEREREKERESER